MRVPFIPYVQGLNDYVDGDGTKYGLAFHNTSNDASDTEEASYATRRPDGISAHVYVDHNSATQSIDTADKTGHAGSTQGNENAISFELTGANGWTRAQWLANINWALLGRVCASIIRHHWSDGSFQVRRASVAEMRANPKIKAMYGHDDMRLAWGGTTHTDPGPGFPWDHLALVIKAALGQTTPPEDDTMLMLARDPQTGQHWLCDGMRRRPIAAEDIQHLKHLGRNGAISLWTGTPVEAPGSIWQGVGDLMGLPILEGSPDGQAPTVAQIADATVDEMVERMRD